jgi:hypothetical protein
MSMRIEIQLRIVGDDNSVISEGEILGSVSFQVRTTMGCSSDVVKSYCILWLSPES